MRLSIRPRAVRRRLGFAIAITVVLTLALMSPGFANLAGSTFEGNDGNLVVDTPATPTGPTPPTASSASTSPAAETTTPSGRVPRKTIQTPR
jgi:hypothetical protein